AAAEEPWWTPGEAHGYAPRSLNVAAGIKEILLVTHASKNAVENHFDTSYELESLLELRVKRQLLAEVQSICPPGVTIMNVRQGEPLGLGHSILC
ncbi:hypothetical protein AAIH11_36995, partial [Pseudomonas aeruginosa]